MNAKQTFSIRIRPELMQAVKLKAVTDNENISKIIESALKEYLGVKQNG